MHHVYHVGQGEEGPRLEEGGRGPGRIPGDRGSLTPDPAALGGLRVAVTRPEDHGGRLRTLLEARGARPLIVPTTALAPPRDPGPLHSAAERIDSFHWIVITSRNAVRPLREALDRVGAARRLQSRICAVGPGTARALEEAGFSVELVPERHLAEGAVEALKGRVKGLRVLYPRARGARDVIPRGLRAEGAAVEAVEAYRTVPDREGARALADGVARGEVDALTFAASSAASSFARAWRKRPWPEGVGVLAIGPVTARTLGWEGLPVHGTGKPHTLEGLVAAVEAWARERTP